MKPISETTLLQQLRWRYAVKQFDPARKIPRAEWSALEQALVLTPSSYGVQPWKFIVVTDPPAKARLRPASWDQAQVTDCSHLVVFAIRKHLDLAHLDRYVDRLAEVRGVPRPTLESFRDLMIGDLLEGPRSLTINTWATCQVYIALGNFMTSAALLGLDTCPMEGIETEKYDQILGLAKRGLASVAACAAGYRAAEDKYARFPKVRFQADDVIERI